MNWSARMLPHIPASGGQYRGLVAAFHNPGFNQLTLIIGQGNDHVLFRMTEAGRKIILFLQGILQSDLREKRWCFVKTAH